MAPASLRGVINSSAAGVAAIGTGSGNGAVVSDANGLAAAEADLAAAGNLGMHTVGCAKFKWAGLDVWS